MSVHLNHMNLKNPVLVVIDVQQGFDDEAYFGKRNNPGMEIKIRKLIKLWREKKAPLLYIKHDSAEFNSPLRAGQPGNELKKSVLPLGKEQLIHKSVNSAFIGTYLKSAIEGFDTKNIILVGLTTDHCVSTTARMGANLGFNVYVVSDACATFSRGKYEADLVHKIALASLEGEFATIVTTKELCQ